MKNFLHTIALKIITIGCRILDSEGAYKYYIETAGQRYMVVRCSRPAHPCLEKRECRWQARYATQSYAEEKFDAVDGVVLNKIKQKSP